jgi:hypothetical protein
MFVKNEIQKWCLWSGSIATIQCYQTYDWWNAWNELYDKWINYLTNVFKNMVCHAICGLTKLNHQCKHFKKEKKSIII